MSKTIIFVYDTLKRGGSCHYLLRDAEFLGTGRTFDRFPMVMNIIPSVIETAAGNHVEGELFSVGPGELSAIDRMQGHPNWYRRKEKTIMVGGEPMRAFVYFLQEMALGSLPNWKAMTFHSVFPISTRERSAFD